MYSISASSQLLRTRWCKRAAFKQSCQQIIRASSFSKFAQHNNIDSPQRCHGDDGVPERRRNAGELGDGGALLCVEHDGGEDDDGHGEREEQEAQLGRAALERVPQDAQSRGVPRKFENPKDPEDPEGDEGPAHVLVVCHDQADVVRHDGHHVNDAHDAFDELVPAGRGDQTQQVLDGEDQDAGRIQTEERQGVVLSARDLPRPVWPAAARDRLHHVGHNGDGDEKARDVIKHQRHGAGVRVLKRAPHGLTERHIRQHHIFVVVVLLIVLNPLRVLPSAIFVLLITAVAYYLRNDAEEGQLLVVGGDALVARVVQLPGSVEVEDVPKNVRVAVEKVLVGLLVEEEVALCASQQGVGGTSPKYSAKFET